MLPKATLLNLLSVEIDSTLNDGSKPGAEDKIIGYLLLV